MFRFNVGDTVYYKSMGGVKKATISSRTMTETEDAITTSYTIAVVVNEAGRTIHTSMRDDSLYTNAEDAEQDQ